MNRHPDIERLQSKSIVRGVVFEVLKEHIRLPSGLEQELLVLDHPGAVVIAPLLATGELLLVSQYRHAAGDWLIELPAGRLERGEDPLRAAKRELEEETGHRAGRWRTLTRFLPAPGFCSEEMTVFVAEDLEAVPGGGLEADADEELETLRMRPEEILDAGKVTDGKTLLAAALLLRERR